MLNLCFLNEGANENTSVEIGTLYPSYRLDHWDPKWHVHAPTMGPTRTIPLWVMPGSPARCSLGLSADLGSPGCGRRRAIPKNLALHSYLCTVLPSAQRARPLETHPSELLSGPFPSQGDFSCLWSLRLVCEEPQVLKMEVHHPWLGLVDLPGGICQPCLDLTRSTCVCIFSATCQALRVPASESHP